MAQRRTIWKRKTSVVYLMQKQQDFDEENQISPLAPRFGSSFD
jgi:hypothetical protein